MTQPNHLQTQMTKNLLLEHCPYCGESQHEALCPRIKAITHQLDGSIARIEFFSPAELEDRTKSREIDRLRQIIEEMRRRQDQAEDRRKLRDQLDLDQRIRREWKQKHRMIE